MAYVFEIDPKIQFIVLYQVAKIKPSRISKLVNVSERTIYSWVKKVEEGINILDTTQKATRTQKIDAQLRQNIASEAINRPFISTRKLAAERDISHTSVRTILQEEGMKYGKIHRETRLSAENKQKRVTFSKEMLAYKGRKIKNTFYSDEMGIKLSEIQKEKAWQLPRKKVKRQNVVQDVKVNCWAGISWNGATSLHIFKENLTNNLYQGIVQEHIKEMQALYPNKTFYLQQDNHPAHGRLDFLDEYQNFKVLDFPPYSPDLNIIENLWATLKDRVAQDAPRTENRLVNSLRTHWQELTKVENLKPYFRSLEERLHECIEKKGTRLPY